jgi:membrane-associated phospholipid phosphatase
VGLVDTLHALVGVDVGSVSNPVAAVPSLHAGWALGVGLGLARYAHTRRARIAGALYPPLVALTIVVTGNHFFLDAAAGTAVMAASLAVVQFLPRRGVEQSGSSPGS